jgi:hypothetical protein
MSSPSPPIFYVGAVNSSGQVVAYVAATYMVVNGSYVTDPYVNSSGVGGSQVNRIYSDSQGDNPTSGATFNPSNYLIVPANYSYATAASFASQVSNTLNQTNSGGLTGLEGFSGALGQMTGAFIPGGPQDLQRAAQWGIPSLFLPSHPVRLTVWASLQVYLVFPCQQLN